MMFSTKARRLCPYLKKTAVRQEAASAAYSLPQAMKQCPYVKELYSGFETKSETGTEEVSKESLKSLFVCPSKAEPKLFKMEKERELCPCAVEDAADATKKCEKPE